MPVRGAAPKQLFRHLPFSPIDHRHPASIQPVYGIDLAQRAQLRLATKARKMNQMSRYFNPSSRHQPAHAPQAAQRLEPFVLLSVSSVGTVGKAPNSPPSYIITTCN
jgi:hypothetical protein